MAFEVAPQTVEQQSACPADSPSSTSEIDRLLSEILNDPNVFSLIDASPTSSSSSAPSPPCYSPSGQQLEQEALASLAQPQSLSRDAERCCIETPSPSTPSASTDDHPSFLPSLPSPSHPHPTSLPIYPSPHPSLSPCIQQTTSPQPIPTSQLLSNVEVCVNFTFADPLLRGSAGRLVSLVDHSLARVHLYHLNQECQVPLSSLEFVSPQPGDPIRVIHGSLTGATGWLINSFSTLSYIQLVSGTCLQVAGINIAKLTVEIGTPVATPTSPHPLPSPTSPSIAPSSLANGQFPSFPVPSPYPASPTGLIPGHSSFPPPNTNRLAYFQAPYSRHFRRPVGLPGPNGTVRVPLSRPLNLSHMTELQRQRYLRQQRDAPQRRLLALRGNALNASRDSQQSLSREAAQLGNNTSSGGGKVARHDQEKALVKYIDRPTQDIVEEVRGRKMMEYDFGSTGDGGDLSSNCIQVPLICPLSQKRMTLPCRGVQCKHPQCFDAEAYIEFNKCVIRPKEKKCQAYKAVKQQLFKCPLCSKPLPFSHLCVDKTLLQVLQDTDEDEVEFDKTGSWKLVEKDSADEVIDLTIEEDDCNSP